MLSFLSNFHLSLVGIFHLLEYTIFDNYAKIDTKHFILLLYYLSWLITLQAWTRYTGYIVKHGFSSLPNGIRDSWGKFGNFGWGVTNDVMIHLLLLLPSHLYFIIKNPKRFSYWLGLMFIMITFAISGSRGGVMGLFIAVPFYIYILIRYGNQDVRRNLILFTILFLGAIIYQGK